MTIHFDWLKI